MHSIKHFFETMQQSRVAFIGTGVTNGDIIRLFRKKNIDVTLLDRKTPEKLGKVMTDEDGEQVLITENKPQDSLELKSEDGDIKIIAEK